VAEPERRRLFPGSGVVAGDTGGKSLASKAVKIVSLHQGTTETNRRSGSGSAARTLIGHRNVEGMSVLHAWNCPE